MELCKLDVALARLGAAGIMDPEEVTSALRPVRIRGRVREFRLEPLKADSVEAVWSSFEAMQREANVLPDLSGS